MVSSIKMSHSSGLSTSDSSSCNLFYVELSYLFSCQDRETNSEEDEDDANNDTIGPLLPTPKVI